MEMFVWGNAELQTPGITLNEVLRRIASRFAGRLHEWWISQAEYRQLQALNSVDLITFIGIPYNEFLGTPALRRETAREEFLQARLCSFERKDLELHYQKQSARFHAIGGIDDVNLKQIFLSSLPEPFGDEVLRIIDLKGQKIDQYSLGQLY